MRVKLRVETDDYVAVEADVECGSSGPFFADKFDHIVEKFKELLNESHTLLRSRHVHKGD